MTEEKQRIAIAEFCGWKDCHKSLAGFDDGDGITDRYVIGIPPDCILHRKLPYYLNDLNAMHEAEKVVKPVHIYNEQLEIVVLGCAMCGKDAVAEFRVRHATAAQRAEALLKTIGKWEDES